MEKKTNSTLKRKGMHTIDKFFNSVPSKKHCNLPDQVSHDFVKDNASPSSLNESNVLDGNNELVLPQKTNTEESVSQKSACENVTYDYGNYVGKTVDDFIKRNLLLHPWSPPKNYAFAFSTHLKKGKEERRYASHNHLASFEWLVYSEVKRGYFCKYCPFFVDLKFGRFGKDIALKSLVTAPLTKFAKLLGKDGYLQVHSDKKYHKTAIESANDFLKVEKNDKFNIINQLNTERVRQVAESRLRLKPIIETIILLGQQNIPLRGHRDDGNLELDNPKNEGNFRALLKYRINGGDVNLKKHLDQSSARDTYISKTSQNLLIECCGEEILDTIMTEVQCAKIYSVMFDETTDISNKSQLTMVLRFLSEKDIKESFVQFIDVRNTDILCDIEEQKNVEQKLTGIKLGKIVIQALKNLNLSVENCVGITTDGCSTMVSEIRGAVMTIQQEAINAVYAPCYSHALNLSISQTSKIKAIRNAVNIMQATISFFTASSKRGAVLENIVGHKLSSLYETRWIERHDGVLQFRTLLPKIISSLDSVSLWDDPKTTVKARGLRMSLCEPETLIAIICLSDVLTCTQQASQFFQKVQIDLKSAEDMISDTIEILTRKRANSDVHFASIFEEVKGISEELEVELKIPRIIGRQTNRENYPSKDPIAYYRQSIFIPMLENVIQDIKSRFSKQTLELYNLSILFPDLQFNQDFQNSAIRSLAQKYSTFLNKSVDVFQKVLNAELESWQCKWKREPQDGPKTAIKLFSSCDKDVYPLIHFLIKVLLTLPLSNATPERTFSSLKRLKTWLRATMGQERLTGLALLNIHSELNLDVDAIIDRFAKKKKHRVEFIL